MTRVQDTIRVLALNVASPSVARAEQQLAWLADRDDDIHVLTELSTGPGSELLASAFHQAGWDVRAEPLQSGQRGVLIAARIRIDGPAASATAIDVLSHRVVAASVPNGPEIIGIYVPSRDETTDSIRRKRDFLEALGQVLDDREPRRPAVLIGDFNIVEPDHRPRYGLFQDWEYAFYEGLVGSGWIDAYRLHHPDAMDHSWVGPYDDGYRFDHVFVTAGLVDQAVSCAYVHETRKLGLSDHSAIALELSSTPAARLPVASTLSAGPASLF